MQRFRIALASLVTAVWLAGYVVAYVQARPSPTELTGLMAFVLSWAFAGQVKDVIQRKMREMAKEGDDERNR